MDKLINLLCDYLENINRPLSGIDITVNYILPIISSILLVTTAIFGVVKYYKEKNRDFNEKILNGVYAPLYQYIIKQEYARSKKMGELPIDKHPIIGLVNEKKTVTGLFSDNVKTEITKRDILNSKDLLKVKESLNFGLVPQDLLVLLNIYEISQDISNSVPDEEYTKIEMSIRNNIINGYQKYRKLLNIDDKESKVVSFEKNELKFNI